LAIVAFATAVPGNRSMFVSTETIAIVISAATLDGKATALGARIDGLADRVGNLETTTAALGSRIDGLADRVGNLETTTAALGSRIDGLADRVGKVETEIGGMRGDLVEVKISVARLEGPPRHLVTSR